MKASKIASIIEKTAPLKLAESWDNAGFQIGDKKRDVKCVLTVLDVTPEVIDEALQRGADMIVSHHPFFFKGIKNIDTASVKGAMIKKILENDLVIYSAHTNLDKASEGLNFYVGKLLGLKNMRPLVPDKARLTEDRVLKFTVFVPEGYEAGILDVIEKYGGNGLESNYTTCTFMASGTGTYKPLENANPFIGNRNELTKTPEVKIETVIRSSKAKEMIKEVMKVHPYEEMAYDIIPTENVSLYAKDGLGVVGDLATPLSPEGFVQRIKDELMCDNLRQAGPRPEEVSKVAICTGAGSEYIRRAKERGASVYLTGDLKHHDAQTAWELGMWTIDAGHFGTEWIAAELLEEIIKNGLKRNDVRVRMSKNLNSFIETI